MPVADVTIPEILAITDAVKARGADQMALLDARFIATARSRDVALSQQQIGQLLRGIYQSSIRRQYKLALHLLVPCMIRKGELIGARWDMSLPVDMLCLSTQKSRQARSTPSRLHSESGASGHCSDLRMPQFNSTRSRWILGNIIRRRPVNLGDVRGLMPLKEIQDAPLRSQERSCQVWIGRMAHDHQQCHAVLHHGRQFVRLVANAPVMGKRDPALRADLAQPLFIGSIGTEVIRVPFHRQAAGTQDLREFLAEVAVREKDRTGVHAARS